MPTSDQYWALPDGISEALPDESWRLEHLRRALLDMYLTWGYRQVMPPMVEYMQSLSTGLGSHLDVQTFKVTDQLTGRMMGIRADMTPQIARIDAHKLRTEEPNRLCYIGTVLRTRAFSNDGSRSPLQVGAELFGHAGIDSDLEIITLLLETLAICHVPNITLDIGHVGIFRGLIQEAGLNATQERDFYNMLERKAIPEIQNWLKQMDLPHDAAQRLAQLPYLYGSPTVLAQARQVLAGAGQAVEQALDYLDELVQQLRQCIPSCELHIDLTELSGYDYHTGVVYAAYTPAYGKEIARGGRYDGIGRLFGRDRPATGFSTDLRTLNYYQQQTPELPRTILAPRGTETALLNKIATLRQAGYRVIRQLGDARLQSTQAADPQQQLIKQNNEWVVVTVNSENGTES